MVGEISSGETNKDCCWRSRTERPSIAQLVVKGVAAYFLIPIIAAKFFVVAAPVLTARSIENVSTVAALQLQLLQMDILQLHLLQLRLLRLHLLQLHVLL